MGCHSRKGTIITLLQFYIKLATKIVLFQLQCCGIETNATIGRPWEAWYTNQYINSGSADKKVIVIMTTNIYTQELKINFDVLFFQVPKSCCKLDTNGARVDCSTSTVDVDMIFTSDCFAAALIFVKGHAVIVGGVAVGISAVMVKAKLYPDQ
jgi:hypothetical protein